MTCVPSSGPEAKTLGARSRRRSCSFATTRERTNAHLLQLRRDGDLASGAEIAGLVRRAAGDGLLEGVQEAHLRFYSATATLAMRELQADYVWLPHRLAVVALLNEMDGLNCSGAQSVVLGRKAVSLTQPTPWAGPRCIPGP